MKQYLSSSSRRALLAAAALALAGPAFAQGAAPVRILVGAPPGGTTDTMARTLAQELGRALGRTVVIENRPGAGGNIAAEAVARSAPDGTTLLMSFTSHAINASLYPSLPFDPEKDFTPLTMVSSTPAVLVANPSLPANNVRELIDAARRNPGKIAYASAGIGNTLHLAGEMFDQMAGTQMLHVPYKGAAPALNDVLGGQVQLMFNSALVVAPQVKDDKLKLIAQTGARRSPALPAELPTVAESVPGFEVTGWFGLFAPTNVPREAVQRLNAAVQRAMATPEAREKLVLLGNPEPPTLSPEGFAAYLDAETQRYARVIKAAHLRLDLPGN